MNPFSEPCDSIPTSLPISHLYLTPLAHISEERSPSIFKIRSSGGRAQVTNQIGVPGTAGAATSRDLGLTSLDLQKRGSSILDQVSRIRDQVDPLSRHISQQDFLTDPSTQLAVDNANAQIRAGANPGGAGLFGLELQGGRNAGGSSQRRRGSS